MWCGVAWRVCGVVCGVVRCRVVVCVCGVVWCVCCGVVWCGMYVAV